VTVAAPESLAARDLQAVDVRPRDLANERRGRGEYPNLVPLVLL
jgi:hypothetical protein